MPHELKSSALDFEAGSVAASSYAHAIDQILDKKPVISALEIRRAVALRARQRAIVPKQATWNTVEELVARFWTELRDAECQSGTSNPLIRIEIKRIVRVTKECYREGQWHWRLIAVLVVFGTWDTFIEHIHSVRAAARSTESE